ncbi:hypothetical protein FOCG_13833 [Fusarium oxysporum f. sp. radicis-lycopersici 26381]|nr:hypothetical protein FOCG_13833 [Fusarium oxysporum f. sp. radicis-lycopersici 26381]
MTEEAPNLLGIIQIPVANLFFDQHVQSRQYSKKQVLHLETLFNNTAIDHQHHRHWIDGYVDQSDVASIVRALGGLTVLRQCNAVGTYPFLGGHRVAYTHGRHRVEASKNIDAESYWTIVLYSTNLASLTRNQMIQRKTDQFQHETPYTNGHIYSKLREYVVNSRDYNDWYMRLSPNKRNNFQAINGHPGVKGALDRLICFPGIMDALFLGNICKYSAWGLLKEFQTCLNYIYNQWSGYTRGDHAIQHDVTPETVKLLEGRAPASSLSDREWIRAVFRAGMVFPSTTNQKQRDDLEKAILRSPGVIPGLRSCQANLLYMGIAAQITLTLLIPNELKRTVKAEDGVVTLRSVLRKCWVETEPYVEVREGEFQPVLGGPNFDLAYNTVIIAALRQFAFMSRDEPKIEAGDSTMQILSDDIYSCKALFQRRAKFLGFQNDLIDQGALKRISPFQPETSPLKEDEEAFLSRVEHRWGRPFTRVFPIIQEVAFLPRLFERETTPAGRITEIFILRDLIQAFLPPVIFDIDSSRTVVSINQHTSQTVSHPQAVASFPLEQPVDLYHGDTEMDVDTPLVSPRALVCGLEDVVMSDLSEPAESETTEDSHFWDHLILEYESLAGSGRSSNRVEELNDWENAETEFTNTSALSIPSYSMVADQSRTVFDDSASSSHIDRSTIWSPSSSEKRLSRRELIPVNTNLTSTRLTSRTQKAKKAESRNLSKLNGYTTVSRRKVKQKTSPEAQRHAFTQSQQDVHLSECTCALCRPNDKLDRSRRVPKLPPPERTPSSSQQHFLPSIYSTSPERSVLPSPEHIQQVEVQGRNTIARVSGNRASFYTDPLPRSTLPSPAARLVSPPQPVTSVKGPWRVSSSASTDSPYYGDSSESSHSHIHSYSSACSPILSRFADNPAHSLHPSDHGSFRSNGSTLIGAYGTQDEGWQGFIDSDDTLTTISLS